MNKLKYINILIVAISFLKASASFAIVSPRLPKSCVPDENLMRNAVQLTRVEKLGGGGFRVFWDLESTFGSPIQSLKPELGGAFYVTRCLPTGQWSVVGEGVLDGINGSLADARVSAPTPVHEKELERVAVQTGNLYARPMVGDLIAPKSLHIEKRRTASRKFEFAAQQLFAHENALTQIYDLSQEGREKIQLAMNHFKSSKGRLLIESHIKREGSRDELQIESQIRATSVAQFIKREFQVAENQLVAIGFGSNEFETGFMDIPEWPNPVTTDSIVLRIIP